MGQVAGGLTAYDREVLTAVKAGAASLSFVGSGFIVLCYVLFKELRRFSFKLVFYLALSDMVCSFFNMVGFWPDRLKRWFPNSSRFGNQQLRSELVALKIEDQHQQVGRILTCPLFQHYLIN